MSHRCEQIDGKKQCVDHTVHINHLAEMPIYDFESAVPPMLTERMLRHQREERQAKKQALLVTVAGVLTQLLLLISMVLLYEYMPGLALIGMGYVAVSLAACFVTAVVYVERRRTTG